LAAVVPRAAAQAPAALPGTEPLTLTGDLSAQMVAGIDKFLMREIESSVTNRGKYWQRDLSSPEAGEKSVAPNRGRLRQIIGAVDARVEPVKLEFVTGTADSTKIAGTDRFAVHAVRWTVFEGVHGEGLLLQPKGKIAARVVALPDADQTPEMIAGLAAGRIPATPYARMLAEQGCQVLVPTLVDRRDTWSGNAALNRFTNQPHREWIYRQAFEMGRHIIGYEVQKVLAAVDWFESENLKLPAAVSRPKVGVAGYAEGGLIAFYAAALDTRIHATLVSGYFGSRQRVWEEPIYRNVFGLLREFGDAEIASLIAPRFLQIEHSEAPAIDGPPKPGPGRGGAAPGRWTTPDFTSTQQEYFRATKLAGSFINFVGDQEKPLKPLQTPGQTQEFLRSLGIALLPLKPSASPPGVLSELPDADARQQRQVAELVDFTQRLLRDSERVRAQFFWNQVKASPTNDWNAAMAAYRGNFWDNVIGRLPAATLPANPRSRKIHDEPGWTGHEVVLDVWPDVYAWGVLLLPKDLRPGERRPVVVCQHGLEGLPGDTINGPGQSGYPSYKSYAARLAERGFIVFAPHNPYRGRDDFRGLQRKANALGKSLFSVILAQHGRILDWLSAQPFVDPRRIGFYGLSYGGKTAMRVPALLDRYRLSICSADFNDWIRKCVTTDAPYSYLFTGEYEMPEWNLGMTFNYAEMAALIAPRPFMVERGHDDGVAPDEWVAAEYAKVRRLYAKLGLPERTAIEFFNGPHTINGAGTFEFLHRHLDWPKRD